MIDAVHTPLPWRTHTDEPSGIGRTHSVFIIDERGWPEGQIARVNVQDGLNEREANAALIVTAVNERPALLARVAELEVALRPFADMEATGWTGSYFADHPEDAAQVIYHHDSGLAITRADFRRARAALPTTARCTESNARGGSQ